MESKFKEMSLTGLGVSKDLFLGKVVIVTGGGRGIGKEFCCIAAAAGAKVIIAELSEEGAAVAEGIVKEGGSARYIKTDVAEEDSVVHMVNESITLYGHIDVLVNNAILCPINAVRDTSLMEFEKTFRVNMTGTFLCCKYVTGVMAKQNQGTVINMVSTASMPFMSAYMATKQAIESFTHSLAGELDNTNIAVIAYGPGMVETPGGVEAFKKLAPLLGMPYDDFIKSGINPGYEGLIPAYDSAFILAYIIANAAKYHNQTVVMFEVLEKLEPVFAAQKPIMMDDLNLGKSVKAYQNLFNAAEVLFRELTQTGNEFNKIQFFVRPLAKNGFKSKVGMGITDLNELLDDLVSSRDISADPSAQPEWQDTYHNNILLFNKVNRLIPGLKKYFHDLPEETARFIKDEDDMKMIREIAETREAVCNDFLKFCNELNAAMGKSHTEII